MCWGPATFPAPNLAKVMIKGKSWLLTLQLLGPNGTCSQSEAVIELEDAFVNRDLTFYSPAKVKLSSGARIKGQRVPKEQANKYPNLYLNDRNCQNMAKIYSK